jgi:hypothetical protein
MECQTNQDLRDRLKTHYDKVKEDCSGEWPEFEEYQAIICPPMIMGYALFRKIWVLLEVSKIHSIDERELKNQTTLQRMVVPHQEGWLQARDILSALISCHGTKTNGDLPGVPAPLKDIVEGKGQGLVILLHGTPTLVQLLHRLTFKLRCFWDWKDAHGRGNCAVNRPPSP